MTPVIEHLDPFEEAIGEAMRACIERLRLVDDAERASREVFLRGQREKRQRAAEMGAQ